MAVKKAHIDCYTNVDPSKIPASQETVYEACVIGTSMVKHIDVKVLFTNKSCFFKSISGGRINDITNILKQREELLKKCKYFIITCGSNDVDSLNSISQVKADFFKLAFYLSKKYPDAKFFFNKLIPRLKTKYLDLAEFEKRRVDFNDCIQKRLGVLGNSMILTHESFEEKDKLGCLLSDGVHISPLNGLSLYVDTIQQALSKIIS